MLTQNHTNAVPEFLGQTTAPLVTGTGVQPTWLDDGRLWYRTTTATGAGFYIVDPTRRTRAPLSACISATVVFMPAPTEVW